MKGGTGVFIDDKNLENNFIEFLQNSEIDFLGKGSYGVVYRATIPTSSTYISKYKNIDYSGFGTEVKSMIIKISSLGYKKSINNPVVIRPISKDDFKREVNIQTDVFLKTMSTLQPLCPAIVHSNIYTDQESTILNIIFDKLNDPDHKKYIKYIIKYITGYSVIGMELMNSYTTMFNLILKNPTEKNLCQNMTLFLLIELALKTGYAHSDFHFSNIMINSNDNSYFKGTPGAPCLIDFGFALKIPVEQLNLIKTLFESKNYENIIQILCNIPRADGSDVSTHPVYEPICDFKPVETEITQLFFQKQEATKDIIELFNSKTSERDKYPLLPLSNSMKNKMFPGLTEGKTENINLIESIEVPRGSRKEILKKILLIVLNVSNHYLSENKNNLIVTKIPKLKYIIDSCYFATFLLGNYEFANKRYYQMVIFVAMYCAGIDNTILDDPFETFHESAGQLYSEKEIEIFCIKYKKLLKNTKFVTIYDIMNQSDLNKLYISDKFKDIMTLNSNYLTSVPFSYDVTVYNNPKEWVKLNFPKTSENVDNYQFPFEEPTPEKDDVKIADEANIIEEKPEINLIESIELPSVDKLNDLKLLLGWVYDSSNKLMNIKNKLKNIPIIEQNKIITHCSYLTCYLFGKNEFAKRTYYQMAGIIAMYCSGINETINKDPFNIYNYITLDIYTEEEIEKKCLKYKELLKNTNFVTIYDFMKQTELNALFSSPKKKNIFQLNSNYLSSIPFNINITIYNKPKEWVNLNFPKTSVESNIIGGRKYSLKRNRRNRNKNSKNTKKHNRTNKRKYLHKRKH